MTYNTFYAEVVAMIVLLVMGIRLHRMSARTRGMPERYLTAAFLLWALGYALWDVPYALTENEWLLERFAFGGRLSINLGTIALALFIRSAFRPDDRWALWFVVGTAVGLLGGIAGSARVGDWLGERPFDYVWYWPELMANVAPCAWMAVEGMISYRNAKKRLRLGLCDALSCNRFLLWGLAGIDWTLLEIVSLAQEIHLALTGNWPVSSDILLGACEFIPPLLIWLAFFPPVAYQDWIERRAESCQTKTPSGDTTLDTTT